MSDIQSYAAPRTLDEAADILHGGNVTIFAGGTDVMPQMKTGKLKLQPTLMNIRHIPELRGISQAQSTVRIGALITMTELLNSDLVRERFNALWQACDHFASDQLRNAGTIGGNICNASPAGDTLGPIAGPRCQGGSYRQAERRARHSYHAPGGFLCRAGPHQARSQ